VLGALLGLTLGHLLRAAFRFMLCSSMLLGLPLGHLLHAAFRFMLDAHLLLRCAAGGFFLLLLHGQGLGL